ncbi:MAG: FxsA family protein [Tabrizicola sp.]|jgi:UPF0716 protein FxsA|nr:FxsA family protein [Tabrizicola sp.]
MWPILAILAVPLIEIGLFVTLGSALGLWLTLLWVILSAALGFIVLKGVASRGPLTLTPRLNEFSDPLSPLAHRLMVVLGGCLLLIPGFLTDLFGLLLLIPPVRQVFINLVSRRFAATSVQMSNTQVDLGQGEWRDVTPENPSGKASGPSKWTQD